LGKRLRNSSWGRFQPQADDIEAQKEGLLPSLVKKAGELGLLSGDITEEDGDRMDKVSVLLMMEKMSQGGDPSWWPTLSYRHWISSHHLFRK